MFYYTVKAVYKTFEDGSEGYAPDLPSGTPFVGQFVNGEYLVAINKELPEQAGRKKELPRQALEATANAKRLKYDDVMGWYVGGGSS
jgi:hypothetical protein